MCGRADRRHDDGDLSEDPPEPARPDLNEPARQVTAPQALSLGDPNYAAVNVAEPTWQQWRAELAAVGGQSPLLHFEDSARTRIELGVTHPGGLATFITGKTTLLSSLIRDDLALRTAKLAASEIAAKGLELATVRGIDSIHLGIGMAQWQFERTEYRAPILLRPLAIRRYGSDFEVRLLGNPYLNPELARVLDEQFRIRLDADAFAALAEQDGTFKPNPVIDRLRGLTMHLEWFNVSPRLVVSSFADVGTSMRADAANLDHPVLDALAGNPSAKWAVERATPRWTCRPATSDRPSSTLCCWTRTPSRRTWSPKSPRETRSSSSTPSGRACSASCATPSAAMACRWPSAWR